MRIGPRIMYNTYYNVLYADNTRDEPETIPTKPVISVRRTVRCRRETYTDRRSSTRAIDFDGIRILEPDRRNVSWIRGNSADFDL